MYQPVTTFIILAFILIGLLRHRLASLVEDKGGPCISPSHINRLDLHSSNTKNYREVATATTVEDYIFLLG